MPVADVNNQDTRIPTFSTSVCRMSVWSLVSSILLLTILLSYQPVTAYNDDLPSQKWSPDYFSYRFFPETRTNYKRRMPSYVQSFSPDMKVGRVRNSWMVGDMGTMYKRVSYNAAKGGGLGLGGAGVRNKYILFKIRVIGK